MARPPSSDPLFAAIHAVRGTPPEPGEAHLHALLCQARERQQWWHLAYAQAVLALRLLNDNDSAQAPQLAEASLAGFEAQGCAWGRCTALSAMATSQMVLGQTQRALELFQASVAVARDCADTEVLAICLHNTAMALYLTGQVELSLAIADEAYGLAKDLGPAARADAGRCLGVALVEWARLQRSAGAEPALWRGHATRAAEVMRAQVRGELPDAEEISGNIDSWDILAAALVLLDEHERARRIIGAVLPHFVAAGNRHAQLFVQRQLGWSHLQCGQWKQALVCADAHHGLVRELGRLPEEHRGLEIEALALEQAGRWQEALAVFKRYHASHAKHVLEQVAEKARSLAVTMQTDRALRESQLDALTDLANRRAFDAALARAVGQPAGSPRALLIIDLDHFKLINDRHGHAAGDEALRAVAAAMQRSCRSSDLPARLGGDEFAVLLEADTAAALQLAQRLRGELRRWRPAAPGMVSPTLSIGVAAQAPGMAAADWLAAADAALYAAKAAGRDAVRAHEPQAEQAPVAPSPPALVLSAVPADDLQTAEGSQAAHASS